MGNNRKSLYKSVVLENHKKELWRESYPDFRENIKKQYKKLRKQKNQYDCLYAIADMYNLTPETVRDILWRW